MVGGVKHFIEVLLVFSEWFIMFSMFFRFPKSCCGAFSNGFTMTF